MSLPVTRYIVDASIAIKWMLDDEDFTAESRAILLAYQDGRIDLLAPDHLYHEVLNALRTGVRMQRLQETDAVEAMYGFLDLEIPTVTGSHLFAAGFSYALDYHCAFYDGLYLALADQADCLFVHADRRLRNTLQGQFASELWVGDFTL